MHSNWFKYPTLFFLLIIYINRGLFVSSPETETSPSVGGEINSVVELLYKIISGNENTVDEDGGSPESYNLAKVAQPSINEIFSFNIELKQPLILVHRIQFPFKESIQLLPVYGTIDHPPERA